MNELSAAAVSLLKRSVLGKFHLFRLRPKVDLSLALAARPGRFKLNFVSLFVLLLLGRILVHFHDFDFYFRWGWLLHKICNCPFSL